MRKTLSVLALLPFFANAEQVPHTFTSGTAAKAAEVNANFTHINEKSTLNSSSITVHEAKLTANEAKLTAIEAKLTTIETTANGSALDILVNGEISLEVNCTDKPEALQLAYHEHLNYRNINFGITGSCFGHISSIRGDDDPINEVQIAGQTVNIYSANPETRANIIPNDETGQSFLIGGFGGGLYLTDVDVTTGENDWGVLLFSRNGHGGLTNTTVNAVGTGAIPVVVQEGAQVYISDVEISNSQIGIFARNNATIRFLGNTTVNSSEGIVLRTGVSVNHQGTVNINSISEPEQALYLDGGVNWVATGEHNTLNLTGHIYMINNSYLSAGTLNLTGGVYAQDSKVKSIGFASISGNTHLDSSTATFDSGTDAAPSSFNCDGISSLTINGWQKFDGSHVDTSTNCADKDAWNQALFNIFNNLSTAQ